jgi:SagB-type dehydrogenase family enzyme
MSAVALVLPPPERSGGTALSEALARRRSLRRSGAGALDLASAGQLLWAAQGVTCADGLRTAPSAGARFPLRLHLVAGEVTGLAAGVYGYLPREHGLRAERPEEVRGELAGAALGQAWVAAAPAVLVVAALYGHTTGRYGERGVRYVHMEAGHAAQNVLLQATALGLAAVPVGAFDDLRVRELLRLADQEVPLYLLPVGPA